MTIGWHPWSPEAFRRARDEAKPVLLFVATAWSRGCRAMDRTSFTDPRVVEIAGERFVAVRVDAERRPDIAERYASGGVPATAFLTPDGHVIGGGTYVPPDHLGAVLAGVADAWRSRADEIARLAADAPVADAQPRQPLDEAELAVRVFDMFDETYGGFGDAPKFPLAAPVALALTLCGSRDGGRMRYVAERSLGAMAAGAIRDPADGGFFRLAHTRDWRMPDGEKLLAVNAELLHLYADAAHTFDGPPLMEVARGVLGFSARLALEGGGWAASTWTDDESTAIDRSMFTGANAVMISATLHAAGLMGDSHAGAQAIAALERVLSGTYRPGAGVARELSTTEDVRGIFEDQVAMAAAALDAAEATGRVPYQMMAEELMLYAVRTMWDDEAGGFVDRARGAAAADEVGLLRRRLKPFVANCEAARLLVRLADATNRPEYAARARAVLAGLAPFAAAHGPLAAHYLLAVQAARPL